MKLIPDDRLYELLRIEKLWNIADPYYLYDDFFNDPEMIEYFEKEEACLVTKAMSEYEDYPGE